VCHWFSPKPFFEMMRGMRKTTKKLESADELAGLGELNPEDREAVTNMIRDFWDASVVVTAPKKKAPAKKRQAEDGGDEEEKPDVKPKKPKAPPKPKNEPHPTEVVECALVAMKSMANELIAKARADGIKIPTDDAVARPAVGAILIQVQREGVGLGSFADGFVDLGLCLDALEKQHGTTKHDVPVDCAVEGNRALAMCFKEFSGYEFKAGDKFKGASSNKVFKAFCACDFLITSGKQVRGHRPHNNTFLSILFSRLKSSFSLRAPPHLLSCV